MASEIVFYDHEWVAVTETWVNPGIRRSAHVATHAERGQCGLTQVSAKPRTPVKSGRAVT
jgi:hypothetical protein